MKKLVSFLMVVSLLACQRKSLQVDLLSDDAMIRTQALEKLKTLPNEKKIRLIPALGEALHNLDSQIAHRAEDALVAMDTVAIPALKIALKDSDVYVRICAAE